MTAKILDGAALARTIRAQCALRAAALTRAGTQPGLAVILVGEDPASSVYVRHKVKDCEESGIRSILERMPADTAEAALLARIDALNADPKVHGILVQLPLPPQIEERRVIERISPDKDVDGFHVGNAGALMTGEPRFLPCTPYGVMKILEDAGVELSGAEAVVVGRSNIVGKPQAMLLLQRNATVTICHSRTRDLAAHCRRADVLVAAVGKARMITADMVKPGAVVIDVGMNRIPDGPNAGKLCGDVDFDGVSKVAGAITPVPGGVGPMTRAMLLVNTLEAAERDHAAAQKAGPAKA
ncbi:MAG: bifunctional methylenetetrahydrofolate dehydrogenase/methenyltetrahydrofolate cyclohydrolase FolD [Burkholderiaceae bacterium]|nr:bifunctional methylenetetrahydrofolate dehydrogenase/methenyltetrahydrofolate cyclohydrolase FolD [Burkholderiaceae bacterium]